MDERPSVKCGQWELVSVKAAHLRLHDVFPEETCRGVTFREVIVYGLETHGEDVSVNRGEIIISGNNKVVVRRWVD